MMGRGGESSRAGPRGGPEEARSGGPAMEATSAARRTLEDVGTTSGGLVETTAPGGGSGAPVETIARGGGPLTDTAVLPEEVPAWERDAGRPDLARGSLIGRYVVIDRLGAGAMGVVFAAFDPELDRRVAIKLLKAELAGASGGSDARARLVREAQALAKLCHPNVVGIHDAGTHGEDVWIAMELVVGRTLRSWLGETSRGWREILEVLMGAGRGLAAAHAAGLVHRDVKPDNVMIGEDGRVRMMDFGLARLGAGGAAAVQADGGVMLSTDVTYAGAIVGTPAYMAPEQFRGGTVGPQADVFGFCVTAWEAILGARPFAGATIEALRDNVTAGRLAALPRRAGVPRWLRSALLRGLRTAPAERWKDMGALLAAFERGQAWGRRGLALGLVAGLAGGVFGGGALVEARARAACAAEGAAIGEAWSPGGRADIVRAFAATGKAYAPAVLAKTTPWLDRWAAGWEAARVEGCVAHRIAGTLDAELYARAEDCFDELRGGFVALVRELGEADATTLMRATAAAAGLPPVEGCLDPATLRERPVLAPEQRAAVLAVRERLARAASMQAAGRYKPGLALAKETAAAARAVAWAPAIAEAELRTGVIESHLGENVAAEESLRRALAAAREAHAPRAALASMTQLAYVVGDRGGRFAEGKVWAEAARTELMHVAGDSRPMEAQLDLNLALVLRAEGGRDEALRLNERALATWIALFGEEHPMVAQTLSNQAIVLADRGEHEAALRLHQRALAIRERALGAEHPLVAESLNGIATNLLQLGRAKEALPLQERVLAIREGVFDEGHRDIGEALANLANAQLAVGDHEGARVSFDRALASTEKTPGGDPRMAASILYNRGRLLHGLRRDAEAARDQARAVALFEASLGKEHLFVAYPLEGLGQCELRLGRVEAAEPLFRRALGLIEAGLGANDPLTSGSLKGLAEVERRRGRLAEALALGERAVAVIEAPGQEQHPELVEPLLGLGETLLALRRPAEAAARLERALALVASAGEPGMTAAEIRLRLAQARWELGAAERPGALALAREAVPELPAALAEEARAWLAARGP